MNVILPYSGKFSRFSRSNTSSQKFVPTKIFSSKMFLLTSQAQCLRVVDPVNCQKVDLFCRRSIKQTAEIFRNLRSTRRNCKYILGVSSLPLAWQFFTDSDRHTLISMEILLSFRRWKCTLWVTISMRKIVGGAVRHCVWPCCKNINREIFSGVFIGDSRKFMLAKISRYTVSLWTEQLMYVKYVLFLLSHYSNKCHSTSSLITLSFWSEPKYSGMCNQTLHEIETGNSLILQ